MKTRSVIGVGLLALSTLLLPFQSFAAGLTPVSNQAWNQAAVRKVLHTFAYGGFATDYQIAKWADMIPEAAIRQILSFDNINYGLSPPHGITAWFGPYLSRLQELWSASQLSNRTCPSDMGDFSPTRVRKDGEVVFSNAGMQNTWITAINTRGLNTFAHNVGFWLVNYHMAVNLDDTEAPLVMDLYDTSLELLGAGEPFNRVLAMGASSAAVAREYGHRNNRYVNRTGRFIGNDDFAREFHQLFFRINGDVEDPDYHENTTIEHTSWVLTGMQLDRDPDVWGTTLSRDWWVAPIDFTDHVDASGRTIRNALRHYSGDLEVLHEPVGGLTAEDKLYSLADVAINHPESLDNLPISIIEFFADDNMTEAKKQMIRESWQALVGTPDDFLKFLQAYAVSTAFHSANTFKYRTAFSRNLTMFNQNTVNNVESFGNSYSPRANMLRQGAEAFVPVHDVFGNQTSLNAANNPDLFKEAYNSNVDYPARISKTRQDCLDATGSVVSQWEKDWARIIPTDNSGVYTVRDVGNWLWQRFTGDSGNNYTRLERAQVAAFLAKGKDFGYLADPANPDIAYTDSQLNSGALATLLNSLENQTLALDDVKVAKRRQANSRVGLAVNFITMTPFMFATGGN